MTYVTCSIIVLLGVLLPRGEAQSIQRLATGTRGMVSSAHPLATEAGLEILRKGGNAFSAAVAIAATLNVVEPMMSGVGGYGTIMLYDAREGRAWFLNSSGRIPRGVDSDQFRFPTPNHLENRRGAKAVSTPGNVHAWEAMSKRFGNLPWSELFKNAIRHAHEGHVLGEWTARAIRNSFLEFPRHAQVIFGRNGEPLAAGEVLLQKDLANTLRSIARQGAKALYEGGIAKGIDAEMRRSGGFLSVDDLRNDRAEWWDPISIEFKDYQIMTASPPANAFDALVRVGMMGEFDPESLGHNSVEYLHRFAEVTKHGFWVRLKHAGDPDVAPPPLVRLLSQEYWKEQVSTIDLTAASEFHPPIVDASQGDHTTHFVVADKWGNVVSATQTLGNLFGSKIMPQGTGIWLNNSLEYCTFEPKGNPMDAHPGRRKLSGDVPTLIMKDGKPWVAVGTPGGHTIGQTVAQMVLNLTAFRMDIQQALDAPRVSFTEPDTLMIESALGEEVRMKLQAMGHHIRVVRAMGNAHGLMIEYDERGKPNRFLGGADARGVGRARGY